MGRLTTKHPVTTTFGHIFEPKRTAEKDGTVREKYQVALLFDTTDPQQAEDLQRLKADALQVGKEAFGEHFETMVQQKSIRWPFRDGGEINPNTGQPRFGQGITFINCSSNSKPDVVSRYFDPQDPQKKPRKVTDSAEYWWGQKAKVNVTLKEYKRTDGNGIACYINGLQLWHEGDKMGNSFDAQSEFSAEGEAPAADYNPGGEQPAGGGGSSLL